MKALPSGWAQIEPLLDEAIASLNEIDRRAVLLRFFENRPLREVGHALGSSEDAAQKRVSRAVEQLRLFFGKHGVVISAATLVTDLSAHAVGPAPAALSAMISNATALTAAATHVSHTLIMTTLQKLGFSTALALAVGVGLYEARELSLQKENARALERRVDALLSENRDLRMQRDDAARKLASANSELSSVRAAAMAGDPAVEAALEAWLERVHALSRWLEKMPDKRIPEMTLLTEDDWLEAAKNAKVDTELGAREAIATLRRNALHRFSKPMNEALKSYAKVNSKQLPADPSELAPFLDSSVDPAILRNYEIHELSGLNVTVTDADRTAPKLVLISKIVDDIYDARVGYTAGGATLTLGVTLARDAITEAVRVYRGANNGQSPAEPAQLAPYLKRPVDGAYLQQVLREPEKIR